MSKDKEKDICQTCKHYWCDFPMPLEYYVAHCEILDKKNIKDKEMDDIVPFPCLKCPFDSYLKKDK